MRRTLLLILALLIGATTGRGQDIPLSKILVPGEGWREVAKGRPGVTSMLTKPSGEVEIHRTGTLGILSPDGTIDIFKHFGKPQDQRTALTYSIEADGKTVVRVMDRTVEPLKLKGLIAPNCLALWPDEGHLVIGESDGAYLWAVRIEKDGSLGLGDRYYSLRTKPEGKTPVTAMTLDAGYLLYACTPLGVQVFDPTGRLSGVIAQPSKDAMTAIAIGGEKADTLFVAAGEKVFARKIQGKASYTLKKEK